MIGTNVFPLDGIFGEVALDLAIDPQVMFDQIDTELAWVFGVVTALNGPTGYTSAQLYQKFFTAAILPFYEGIARQVADSMPFFHLVTTPVLD